MSSSSSESGREVDVPSLLVKEDGAGASALPDALTALRESGSLALEDTDYLAESVPSEIAIRLERQAEKNAAVEDFLAGRTSLENCLRSFSLASHGTAAKMPKAPPRVARRLSDYGVLEETQTGPRFREPFWPFFYRILQVPATHSRWAWLRPINAAVRWLISQLGTHQVVADRRAIADAINSHVGHEPALIVAKTPVILNPMEFANDAVTQTKIFAETLRHSVQPVVYVWDRHAIVEQIRAHLASSEISIEALQEHYSRHLATFSPPGKLCVLWGDTAPFTRPAQSLSYFSGNRILIGARPADRVTHGVLVDRNRLSQALAMTVSGGAVLAGWPAFAILGPFLIDWAARRLLAPQDASALANDLEKAGFERLNPDAPEDLVATVFAEARSSRTRRK